MVSRVWPVSYTHLDVYKRQILHMSDSSVLKINTGSCGATFYDMNGDGKDDLVVGEFGEVLCPGQDPKEKKPFVQGRCRVYLNYGTKECPVYKAVSYTHLDVYKRQRLSMTWEEASIKQIISEIKKNSECSFVYSDADIAGVKCKNVSFKDETVESILAICLKGTGLNFAIEEKTIGIWKGNPVKQIRCV